MLIAILKNPYFIAGVIGFALLFGLGLYLDFSWSEALLASAVLTVVGIGAVWWKYFWP